MTDLRSIRVLSIDPRIYPDGVHYALSGEERDLAMRFVAKNASFTTAPDPAGRNVEVPYFSGVDGVVPLLYQETAGYGRHRIYVVHAVDYGYYALGDGTRIGLLGEGVAPEWQDYLGVDDKGRYVG